MEQQSNINITNTNVINQNQITIVHTNNSINKNTKTTTQKQHDLSFANKVLLNPTHIFTDINNINTNQKTIGSIDTNSNNNDNNKINYINIEHPQYSRIHANTQQTVDNSQLQAQHDDNVLQNQMNSIPQYKSIVHTALKNSQNNNQRNSKQHTPNNRNTSLVYNTRKTLHNFYHDHPHQSQISHLIHNGRKIKQNNHQNLISHLIGNNINDKNKKYTRKRVLPHQYYENYQSDLKRRKGLPRQCKTNIKNAKYNPYLQYSSTDENDTWLQNMRHQNLYYHKHPKTLKNTYKPPTTK